MRDRDFPYVKFDSDEVQTLFDKRCTRCSICDKVFNIPVIESYTYKLTNPKGKQRLFCSWTCYRKAEQICKNKRSYKEQYTVD